MRCDAPVRVPDVGPAELCSSTVPLSAKGTPMVGGTVVEKEEKVVEEAEGCEPDAEECEGLRVSSDSQCTKPMFASREEAKSSRQVWTSYLACRVGGETGTQTEEDGAVLWWCR